MHKKRHCKTLWRYVARIIKENIENNKSIKNLVYDSPYTNKKKLMCAALRVSSSLKVLEKIIKKFKLHSGSINENYYRLCCQIDEFINCPQNIGYLPLLKENQKKIKKLYCKHAFTAPIQDVVKFVRLNPLKGDTTKTFQILENKYSYHENNFENYNNFLSFISNIPKNTFTKDYHIKDLLVFSGSIDFHNEQFYKNGSIVIQNKASCLPALALNPPKNAIVLEACAAPGNKTCHLSALMHNTGKIYAVDKDETRFNVMKKLLKNNGVSNFCAINSDFLEMDPKSDDASSVEYILVDPSCSGSGMNNYYKQAKDVDRITKLANIQAMLLSHAFLFENVKRILYSTCSIYEEENEGVVDEVVKKSENFEIVKILPEIITRGNKKYAFSDKVVSMTNNDMCNGFFVAMFEKKKEPKN
ncbi:hypothetical protein A3Q56_02914 [Intoshia linei]|uniref:SAM-dependent MTase RsmB/NOP-type domain-containing protein n=1 Tax=Intoshia linei TaxID=1819745 RepID=A0A177B6L1_9BILA|nr:hypothetical protein A3Q56_02914 [Intoshia linei]